MPCLYIKRSRDEFITIIKAIYNAIEEKIIVLLSTISVIWKLLINYLRNTVTLTNNLSYICLKLSAS